MTDKAVVTTRSRNRMATREASVLVLLLQLGSDPNLNKTLGDLDAHGLAEAGRRELATLAVPIEIRETIERLARSIRWSTDDRIPDRRYFLEEMFEALNKVGFPPAVLAEAASRLIGSEEWFPATALVLRTCRAVKQEARKGLRLIEARVKELDAPKRELEHMLEKEAQRVEDQADPIAGLERWRQIRVKERVVERRRDVQEASDAIKAIEYQLDALTSGKYMMTQRSEQAFQFSPFSRFTKEVEQRVRTKLERSLAEKREALAAAEASLAEAIQAAKASVMPSL
jgi:hypothetical protein